MRDKLTKKRVHVDYRLVISLAKKEDEFLTFLQNSSSKISFNRKAYNFCKHKKIDVDSIYSECLANGIKTYDEYRQYLFRIAKTPWLDED